MNRKRKRVDQRGVMLLAVLALCMIVLLQTMQEDGEAAVSTPRSGQVKHILERMGLERKDEENVLIKQVEMAENITAFVRLVRTEESDPLVLTYASFGYRETLINWLLSLRRVNVTSSAIVCLDKELREYLHARGVPCFLVESSAMVDDNGLEPGSEDPARQSGGGKRKHRAAEGAGKLDIKSIGKLWILRLTHLLELLENGISVVLSDSDAVWSQNAFKTGLLSPRTGDIVASRGKYPFDMTEQWGATVCMGLVYFRAIAPVKAVIRSARLEAVKANDDQVGLNRALFQLYGIDPEGVFGHKVDLYSGEHNVSPATDVLPRFVLLSHAAVPRFCNRVPRRQWSKVQIAHCHPKDGVVSKTFKNWGNAQSRNNIMNKYDLWCPSVPLAPVQGAAFLQWLAVTADSCPFLRFRK